MATPDATTTPHATRPTVDSVAMVETCTVLRELAASDRAINPGRGQVSAALAALVAATARHHQRLPVEVADRVRPRRGGPGRAA